MPRTPTLASAAISLIFIACIISLANRDPAQAKPDMGMGFILGSTPVSDGGVYATGPDGLYYVNGGHAEKVTGIDGLVIEIVPDALSGAYAHTAGKIWRLEKATARLVTEGTADAATGASNPHFALWQSEVQQRKDAEAYAATR